MNTLRSIPLAVIVLCPLLFTFRAAGQGKDEEKWAEEKAEITTAIGLRDVKKLESEAIKLLDDEKALPKRPKAAFYAVKYLEAIRSQSAIPVLCDRLLYEQQVKFYDSFPGDRNTYPASAALVAIGHPAVEGLLLKMTTTDTSPKYRDVAVGILIELVGEEGVIDAVDAFQKAAVRYKTFTDSRKHELYKNYNPQRLLAFKKELRTRYKLLN